MQSKKPDQAHELGEADYFALLSKLGLKATLHGFVLEEPCALDQILEEAPVHGIALLISALYRPTEALDNFRSVRFSALVSCCLDMDSAEARVARTLLGAEGDGLQRNAETFNEELREALRAQRLQKLFCPSERGPHHRGICPSGYNERTGEIHPEEMAQWRADFRAMSPERQMLAASIVWMYQSGPDSRWLRRVPCTWCAVEAIHYLKDTDCLLPWLRLLVTYPGW